MLLRTAVNSPGYIVERKQDTINCCRHKLTSLIPNLGMVLSVSDTTSKICCKCSFSPRCKNQSHALQYKHQVRLEWPYLTALATSTNWSKLYFLSSSNLGSWPYTQREKQYMLQWNECPWWHSVQYSIPATSSLGWGRLRWACRIERRGMYTHETCSLLQFREEEEET